MVPSRSYDEFYRGRRVCVTGGAGFIGSHLCEALAQRGADVSVIDDLSNGDRSNLNAIADRIQFIEGSILDVEAMTRAMDGAEIVFHQAAIASVPRSVEEPALYFEVNARGTLAVLEAARAMNIKRVIFAASSSAYGESAQLPKIETMLPMPLSPYAATKLVGEQLLQTYCNCYEMSGVSLRYFNIFGPRQRADSPYAAVVPRFAEAMLSGRKPLIYGDGSQTRDFTHIDNAVHANLLAGASTKNLRGEIINIACGERVSLLELLQAMAKLLGAKPECEFAPPRAGDVQHSLASIDAARELIGFEPIVSFEDGLRRTLEV